MYYIFNRRTGTNVAKCKTKRGARSAVNQRDKQEQALVHYIVNGATGKVEQ